MHREEAEKRLRLLEGQDLVPLAHHFGVTIWKDGKINKGWAGHTIERYLGLPLNSSQAPNFGTWELKIVPLKKLKDGRITVKETMAITMIDDVHIKDNPFKTSHLLSKLRKAIICARLFLSKEERSSTLVKVTTFDLDDPGLIKTIENDYEETRTVIAEQGFEHLTGRMGTYIQPRTKGPGHGSTSRAFYARTVLVKRILGLL